MAYRQCPKRLWLEVHAADEKVVSVAAERAFAIGHDVGETARRVYDGDGRGVLVDPFADGFARAIAQTEELMRQDNPPPVFEATLSSGRAIALADVMLPLPGGGWKMIEVKSSTRVKDYHHDDVAVQWHIARAAGVDMRQLALAHIDNSWTYPGDGQYRGLFAEVDLTEEAGARDAEVKQWIAEGRKIVSLARPPEVEPGEQCQYPFRCGFYHVCHKQEEEPMFPADWLPYKNATLKALVYEQGVCDMRDVPDNMLSPLQKRVKRCTIDNVGHIDHAGAREELGPREPPWHFLDFETAMFAVPIWAGTRPYQQLVFQYSLHRLDADGDLRHMEFLNTSGRDPSRAVAESLLRDCGEAGAVFVYSPFEKARIRELAGRFADLADGLHAINARIVDLLPITRRRYYHPAQRGSFSIKAVLPTVAPSLNYADLDGIQDGMMAMDAYAEAAHPETPPARKQEIERQLREYCRLDTYAMLRLWRLLLGEAPPPTA